jgi:hypothetical protein
MTAIEQELTEQISKLDAEKQSRVLEFIRSLSVPQGIRGEDLIVRARQVNFDPADLEEMKQAIEAGCEHIEPSAGHLDLFT